MDDEIDPIQDTLIKLPGKRREEILARLSYDERNVIMMLWGLGDEHNYTVEQTAQVFSLTPFEILEILKEARTHIGDALDGK